MIFQYFKWVLVESSLCRLPKNTHTYKNSTKFGQMAKYPKIHGWSNVEVFFFFFLFLYIYIYIYIYIIMLLSKDGNGSVEGT
jgi:hypothetical protein